MLSLLGLGDTWQPDAEILVPRLVREPAANNNRVCGVVGTLTVGSRCMADKERRGTSRACHDGKDPLPWMKTAYRAQPETSAARSKRAWPSGRGRQNADTGKARPGGGGCPGPVWPDSRRRARHRCHF